MDLNSFQNVQLITAENSQPKPADFYKDCRVF
jgi:hypothetical protein